MCIKYNTEMKNLISGVLSKGCVFKISLKVRGQKKNLYIYKVQKKTYRVNRVTHLIIIGIGNERL